MTAGVINKLKFNYLPEINSKKYDGFLHCEGLGEKDMWVNSIYSKFGVAKNEPQSNDDNPNSFTNRRKILEAEMKESIRILNQTMAFVVFTIGDTFNAEIDKRNAEYVV